MAAPVLALLVGCSNGSGKTSMNPIDWWHNLEGGKIAEDRPPPPNADQPYPNLSTVPARPTPPDKAAMQRLTDSLVGDRVNAQHTAAENPLADPTLPSASPGLFGVGTLPPPPRSAPAGQATASLDAASSTGAGSASASPQSGPSQPGSSQTGQAAAPSPSAAQVPPAPPSRAPLRSVESAPLDAPSAAPPVASLNAPPPVTGAPAPPAASAPPAVPVSPPPIAAAPPQIAQAPPAAALPAPSPSTPAPAPPPPPAQQTSAQQTASAALPPLPTEPPPRPGAAGPAPSAAPTPQTMPVASANAARVVFPAGAATLSPEDINLVKSFASKRGNAVIAVTGFGDATGNDITSQTNALGLGLSRAQAVANELTSAGVPQSAIRVGAEAAGRGARLLLLQ